MNRDDVLVQIHFDESAMAWVADVSSEKVNDFMSDLEARVRELEEEKETFRLRAVEWVRKCAEVEAQRDQAWRDRDAFRVQRDRADEKCADLDDLLGLERGRVRALTTERNRLRDALKIGHDMMGSMQGHNFPAHKDLWCQFEVALANLCNARLLEGGD